MAKQSRIKLNRTQRANRTRSNINGTAERPRLSVYISNLHISVQAIDDTTGKTLASASTVGKKSKGTMLEKAEMIGGQVAEACQKAGIESVIFDRGSKQYHGRVQALADAARKKGLKF